MSNMPTDQVDPALVAQMVRATNCSESQARFYICAEDGNIAFAIVSYQQDMRAEYGR